MRKFRKKGFRLKYAFQLNQAERMQMKALICFLGVVLLLILMSGRLLVALMQREKLPEESVHIPVVEIITNVWIMDADEEKLLLFRDGAEESYYYDPTFYENRMNLSETGSDATIPLREQLADVELTDGLVTTVTVKGEKIHGRILRADVNTIELEGYGTLPLAADYKGYRIYNALRMCAVSDLPFGYDQADYVVEDGEICGILWAKEAVMQEIRVLIKTSDFAGIFHDTLTISSESDLVVQYGSYDQLQTEFFSAGSEITIDAGSPFFLGERIVIAPAVHTGKFMLKNVKRSQGIPEYRGHLELLLTEEGIVAVNEVLLEEYLYSVVPSEMPASYREEALQAQAICARTYAYARMMQAGYPQYGAHVDDSTAYQVYNNIREQESTTTAVKNTYGRLLYTPEGIPADTYYYSTSCGAGTDAGVWQTDAVSALPYLKGKMHNHATAAQLLYGEAQTLSAESLTGTEPVTGIPGKDTGEWLQEEAVFYDFITNKHVEDFEVDEPWYRWHTEVPEIDREQLLIRMQKRYEANKSLILTLQEGEFVSEPIRELSKIKKLEIMKRGSGGVGEELMIQTGKNTYKIISEYNIRYVLNVGDGKVLRQDGSEVVSSNLLPSAFMILELIREKDKAEGNIIGYRITGGGFGHGVGMSQNGANNMALSGYNAEEILGFYYEGCVVRNIYE